MSSSSNFRRSQSIFRPCITVLRQQQLRRSFSSQPPFLSPCTHSNRNADSTALPKWISGIITGSAAAVALYFCSSSSQFPSFSFADSSEAPPAAVITCPVISSNDDHKIHNQSRFLFGDAYRRKVFFNYEKRIRTRSPPEKIVKGLVRAHVLPSITSMFKQAHIFEYFASTRFDDGEIYMTPADLMRSVVPVFPPSESNLVRDGYLRGERSPGDLRCSPSEFFMLFDTDNDGLISFKEYIFFVTLLSIPESSFSVAFKMFDLDSNGKIDRDEFKKVMALMRAQHRQGTLHSDGLRAGRSVGGSVENGGLLEYFFAKDGKKLLHYDTFAQFLRDLHDEILRLEFAHYDYKLRGTMSAKDFALSMVASADLKDLNKLLDRVDDLDHELRLSKIRVTFEEFKDFSELRKKLQPFSLALFSFGKVNGLLTRNDFKRAASQVCGISLTDTVIDLIFHVFDANSDGNLSYDEFIRVLKQREREIAQPTETAIMRFRKNSYSLPGFQSQSA